MSGWIGVDLDGTLAFYDGWKGVEHIGEPIPGMLFRVRKWLEEGKEVRIFTARVARLLSQDAAEFADGRAALRVIEAYCLLHVGQVLPVTCIKDFGMIELWDDRARRVVENTGEPCCG